LTHNLEIIGSGGGKGSQNQRTPQESPDSLQSISKAKIVDLLGEGEMRGLVDGDKSIYLDSTPLRNSDGSLNFQNVIIDTRSGTQDQTYIQGFPSVENEVGIEVPLEFGDPVVRTVSGSDLSAIRIRLALTALVSVNEENGDRTGSSVSYAIDIATDGGAYTTVLNSAFTGKTTTTYERSHRIDLPPGTQWQVRIRRLTPDSTSDTLQNGTRVVSLTEIIDAKLRYPNSALVAVEVDAQDFQRIPTRAYNVYGRIILVPANYDPETRIYAMSGPGTTNGIWDGTFKSAWTNNPAWIYYDVVTNDRFGLGDHIPRAWVDIWNLYQIAQYCDEMVSDGFGGMEPRFTCNIYMQTRTDAYKVLQDLAAVFRGVSYYAVGQMIASADMPKQVSAGFTNADVVDGKFNYEGSSRRVRHTVALVSWSDQTDFGRQKVERVEFRPGLVRYGIQETEVTAIGCTSRGQAQRIGNHILVSENLETETVSFKVGLSGVLVSPGDVFNVSNANRAGRRMGGRISSFTDDSVTVDALPEDGVAPGDTIKVMLSTGRIESRTIQSVAGRVITVTVDWSSQPAKQAVFIFEKTTLVAETFRCVAVIDNEDGTFSITGLSYRADKFAYIDDGTRLEAPPVSVVPPSNQPPPTNVVITSNAIINQANADVTVTIEWDAAPNAVSYNVEWRRDDMDWVRATGIGTTSFEINNAYSGQYLVRVRAINSIGSVSIPATSALTNILGKTQPPPSLTSLTTNSIVFAIGLEWGLPQGATDTERTEIWYGPTPDRANAIKLGDFAYPQTRHQINGLSAGARFYFWGRLVDRSGNVGPWYPTDTGVMGESSVDQSEYDEYFSEKISESALGQELRAKIDSVDAIVPLIYDPAATYSEGQLVIYDGIIYSWSNPTPGNTVPPGPNWTDVGTAITEAGALVGRVDSLETQIDVIDGEVTAQGQIIDGLFVQLDVKAAGDTDWGAGDTTVFAGTVTIQSVFAGQDFAQAQRIDQVNARVDNTNALVQTESTARASADSALAQQINTVQTNLGTTNATVSTNSTAINTLNGKVTATYTIRAQVTSGGQIYTSGMGLGVEQQPDGSYQSQFLVQADRFAVINVVNNNITSPFVIQGGQTFISQAMIGNAWITNAMIGNTIQSNTVGAGGQPRWKLDKNGTLTMVGPNAGSGYLTINDSVIRVFDNAGTLRVRLGIW